MQQPRDDDDLARFLVRAVLDPEFCALARRAPEEAFAGYALSAEERDVLRAGDEGVLRLLGQALRGAQPAARTPGPPSSPARDGEPSPVPVALAPISLLLTVQPHALQTPEGIRMSFTASVAAAPQAATPDAKALPAAAPWSPWEHDLDSQRTLDAAAAARVAPPKERRARILALLSAVTSRERLGGDGERADG